MNNLTNVNDALKNLSDEERQLALDILKQMAAGGESAIFEDLKYSDFEEIPVDIDTFLDDDRYLGRGIWAIDEYTGEKRCTLFPYWRETLHKIFPDNLTTAYNTLILSGGIGLGKTLISSVAMLYLLYRMLCLKDPYNFYGLMPSDKITFSMLNITLETAKGVGWDRIQQLLQGSDWFMAHGELNASRTAPTWQPDKRIELIFGSSNNHVIGRALFCLDGETEILTTTGIKKLQDLVDKDIQVISVNNSGNKYLSEHCTVKPTVKTTDEYKVELADGTVIRCTSNHRLRLTDGTYKEAQYLIEDDELMTITTGAVRIKSVEKVILSKLKQYYDVIDAAPYNNFLIKTISGYVVSHNCNFTDEANFSGGNMKNVENQKTKLKKMIAQIDARMVSRFGKGVFLPTLNIIASSKDSDQSFLEDYIKQKSQDSKTLTIDEPQWVIRTDKGTPNDPGAFWVAVGGKLLAHELLPVDATDLMVDTYRKKGYTMIKVPPIYRRDFETNLDQSLMDAAGLSSASSTKFISGSRLVVAKTNAYENLFIKDIIEVGDNPEDHLQYANFFDLTRVSIEDKARPLFIHLDMSTGGKGSGDKTGIAGVWITGKQPSIPGQAESLSLRYKLAFSVSVKSPKGYNISFIKNQNFIKWLREQGFAVKMVTADTYQSAPVLQELSAAGFKTSIQSVDRVNADKIAEPYYYLKSAIYDRRVEIYDKCDLLTEELVNLEREASGKINHPENGKYGSKDQADAFCGALFTASKFAEEYSYQYGDNLAASLDVSIEDTSDAYRKQQMIIDFETELAKINMSIDEEQRAKNEEYKRYMDISDGIIVL